MKNSAQPFALTLIAYLLASPAQAQSFSWSFPRNVKELSVSINDSAKNGCWTNAALVKSMAEQALKKKGYNVTDFNWLNGHRDDDGRYTIEILVTSSRIESGCYGFVSVTAKRAYQSQGEGTNFEHGNLVVGDHIVPFTEWKSANMAVVQVVQQFIDSM